VLLCFMHRVRLGAFFSWAILFSAVAARAGTLTVSSGGDAGGTCPGATCTLRQAILDAMPGDTIDFAPGLTTIDLTTAELVINKNLTISGPGADLLTVQRSTAGGTPTFRIFNMVSASVTISGLKIANGNASPGGRGGGIFNSSGSLTVGACIISGNTGRASNGCGGGGGIFNSSGGTVNISDSTLSGNNGGSTTTVGGCGGGGGILNSAGGTVNISDSTLSDNIGGDFNGVSDGGGRGGGLQNLGGTVTLLNSTISGNFGGAVAIGGGLFNAGGGTMHITNSTVSGNTSFGFVSSAGGAGGIHNDDATVIMTSSTLSYNSGQFGGFRNLGTGVVRARNTIIANNTRPGSPWDFSGTLTSEGYNLIGDTQHGTITGTTTGNQLDVNPMLGPLQDNGGPTFTHAFLSGSTAIDGGDASGSTTDQRGLTRPVDDPAIPNATGGDGSDIGAYEEQTLTPVPTPTPTLTPSPTPTPSAIPSSTPAPARSLNISTRSRVQAGDNVMIGGFIITGNVPKKVILRAIGPSLQGFGLNGVLADPMLDLHGPNGSLILSNDNWRENPDQALQIQASGIPPQDDLESAIVATLPPAGYTAVVSGQSSGIGLGLIEVYDLEPGSVAKLANIATRAVVGTGDNVVIGGFILGGAEGSPRIIIRALGPALASLGIANPLADPTLELRDGNGMLIAFNDNWRDNPAQAALIKAAGLQPRNDLEAVIAATLPPAAYTGIVAGRNGGIGVGLVEVYNLQ